MKYKVRLFLALLLIFSTPVSWADTPGRVLQISGGLVQADNVLSEGDLVQVGSRLATSANSTAVLGFSDGMRLEMASDSALFIEEFKYFQDKAFLNSSISISILKGSIKVVAGRVGQGNPSALKIYTSMATVVPNVSEMTIPPTIPEFMVGSVSQGGYIPGITLGNQSSTFNLQHTYVHALSGSLTVKTITEEKFLLSSKETASISGKGRVVAMGTLAESQAASSKVFDALELIKPVKVTVADVGLVPDIPTADEMEQVEEQDLEISERFANQLASRGLNGFNSAGQLGYINTPNAEVMSKGMSAGLNMMMPYDEVGFWANISFKSRFELAFSSLALPNSKQEENLANEAALSFKVKLLEEDLDGFLPRVSLGLQDFAGSRARKADYIAFGKSLFKKKMDLTIGIGSEGMKGGFFGLRYDLGKPPLTLVAEYDSFDYEATLGSEAGEDSYNQGRLSYGIEYHKNSWYSQLALHEGEEVSINVGYTLIKSR